MNNIHNDAIRLSHASLPKLSECSDYGQLFVYTDAEIGGEPLEPEPN